MTTLLKRKRHCTSWRTERGSGQRCKGEWLRAGRCINQCCARRVNMVHTSAIIAPFCACPGKAGLTVQTVHAVQLSAQSADWYLDRNCEAPQIPWCANPIRLVEDIQWQAACGRLSCPMPTTYCNTLVVAKCEVAPILESTPHTQAPRKHHAQNAPSLRETGAPREFPQHCRAVDDPRSLLEVRVIGAAMTPSRAAVTPVKQRSARAQHTAHRSTDLDIDTIWAQQQLSWANMEQQVPTADERERFLHMACEATYFRDWTNNRRVTRTTW